MDDFNKDSTIVKSQVPVYQKPGLIVVGLPGSSKTTWVENEIGRIHELGTSPLVRQDLEGGRGSVWENDALAIWEAQEPASCYSYFQQFQSRCQLQGVVVVIDSNRLQKFSAQPDKWRDNLVRYISDWLNILPTDAPLILFLSHVDSLPGANELEDLHRVDLAKLLNRKTDVDAGSKDFLAEMRKSLNASRESVFEWMQNLTGQEIEATRFRELVMMDSIRRVYDSVIGLLHSLESSSDAGPKVFSRRKVQVKWSEMIVLAPFAEIPQQLSQLTAWVNVKAAPVKQELVVVDAEPIVEPKKVEPPQTVTKSVSSKSRIAGLVALFVAIASVGAIPAVLERKQWSATDSVHKDVMQQVVSETASFDVGDSFQTPDQFCRWYLDVGDQVFPENHQGIIAKWFSRSFVSPLIDSSLQKLQERSHDGWSVEDQRAWMALVTLSSPTKIGKENRAERVNRSLEQVITYLNQSELYTKGISDLVATKIGSTKELNASLTEYQRPVFSLVSRNLKQRVDERLSSPIVDESVRDFVEVAMLYKELKNGRLNTIARALLGEIEGAQVQTMIDSYVNEVERLETLTKDLEGRRLISSRDSLFEQLQKRAFGQIEETFDREVSFIVGGNTEILKEYHRAADIEEILAAARAQLLSRQGFKDAESILRQVSFKEIHSFFDKQKSHASFLSLAQVFNSTDNLLDPAYNDAWAELQSLLKKPAVAQPELQRRVYKEWEVATLEYIVAQLRADVYDRVAFPVLYDDQKSMSLQDMALVSRTASAGSSLVDAYLTTAVSERAVLLLKRHEGILQKLEGVSKTLVTETGQAAGVDVVLAPYDSTVGRISETFGLDGAAAIQKTAAKVYGAASFNGQARVRLGQNIHQKLSSVPWDLNQCFFRFDSGKGKAAARKVGQFRGDWALCRLMADKLQQGAMQMIKQNGISLLIDDTYGKNCIEVQLYSPSNLEQLMNWPGRFELNDVLGMSNALRAGNDPLQINGLPGLDNLLLPPVGQ